jgi:pimeloyl-ACP methyl ester carboxylesterase
MEALRAFFAGQFFLTGSDPELKERLITEACNTPQHVVASAFRNMPAFDAEAALRALGCPALHIDADPVIGDHERLMAAKPDVVTGKTVGSGHFHQLEVPEQVNAMIDRFLAVAGSNKT